MDKEILRIIDNIADRLASKYRFGYHELEDMKQQARLVALEGLESYDGERPLENFLWTHVRNRLYNFKRDNYFRPEKPCDKCPLFQNEKCTKFQDQMECDLYEKWLTRIEKRKSLMSTVDQDDVLQDYEDVSSHLDKKEIFNLIDSKIPVELREYWIRFIHNLRLNKLKREQIILEIQMILKEHNIGF